MTRNGLLFATDLDRTLIPNGRQPEHPRARELFHQFCQNPDLRLVYVTGRDLALVEDAIADFSLPFPDYAVTDVGTCIYQRSESGWQHWNLWQEKIGKDWRGIDRQQLAAALESITLLELQEESKQGRFKLSYYLPLSAVKTLALQRMQDVLSGLQIDCSLIWSVDEARQIGLIDVLPCHATKLHALQFLQQQLNYSDRDVVFAGDSGNDLPVLASSLQTILVANASSEIKIQATEMAETSGHGDSLFIARNQGFPLGGNYAAGILQGIAHFRPEFLPTGLEQETGSSL